jgi:excisionase family DNA binding protein
VSLLLEAPATQDLLDQDAAARLLRSSRQTLYRLRRTGQLEAVRHGSKLYYRRADLERLWREGWEIPSQGWDGNNIRIPPGCK